jgi:predicted molibdopterin-dependent oxidoreductase YjgC
LGSVVPEYAGVFMIVSKRWSADPVWDQSHPGTPFSSHKPSPAARGKFHVLEYVPAVEAPDDEFPFILTTGRVLEHWHGGTMTRHSQLDALYPQAQAFINTVDAEMLGLENGQAVCVTSRRGSINLRLAVSEKISAGVVFIPFHFAEAAANLLTIDALDPQAMIPEYKACAVQIFPAREQELANPEQLVERGRY